MLKIAITIAVFLFASPVIAQTSQPSIPGKIPPSHSEKSPLIVKIQNPQKSKEETDRDPAYQQAQVADYHFVEIGILTVTVGLIQAFALCVTFLIIAFVGVRQLRAYVNPTLRAPIIFSLTEPYGFSVSIQNLGQTPARYCEFQAVAFVGAIPLSDSAKMGKPKEPKETLRHSKLSLYPQAEMVFAIKAENALTDNEIAGLRAKKCAMYVAGETRYRDVFRRKRRSEFCIYVDPESALQLVESELGLTAPPKEVRFVAAHVWNEAT